MWEIPQLEQFTAKMTSLIFVKSFLTLRSKRTAAGQGATIFSCYNVRDNRK